MCICNIYWRVHFAGQCTRATNTRARNTGQGHSAGCISHASALFPRRRSELSAGIETLDFSDDDEHGEESVSATCVAITCARAIISSAVGKCLSLLISREYISVRGNDASVV